VGEQNPLAFHAHNSAAMKNLFYRIVTGLLVTTLAGCGAQPSQEPANSAPTTNDAATATTPRDEPAAEPVATPRRVGPVRLGGGAESAAPATKNADSPESVMAALRPLQVWLGKWNGTSRKAVVDQPEWVWDFRTEPNQPALVLTSDNGEFLRTARLTYLPAEDAFQLTATDGDGQSRFFQGKFTQPVADVPGDDKKLQRTFKLELTEHKPVSAGEQWQIAFAQQDNHRYIVEVNRKRGAGPFTRIDTIHTQREGTSFAISATDYGEKTCIISQGLGTIPVTHEGKTYWVCCSGCQAAFEEDPQKWIARYEARQKMKVSPVAN
jgi:hypothetical protein